MLWENINSILTRKKCSKWLETQCIWVFGCANSNDTGFEAVHSDVSELWAICMHYCGNCSSLDYFQNILQHTQNTTPKENSQKMFHNISSLIVLFSYGKVKGIFA